MSKEILLTMPDDMYSQVRHFAEKTNQPLDTYILEILADTVEKEGTTVEFDSKTPLPDDPVEREKAAYISMHNELWQKYPGQQVAIHNGELVDHDTDGVALSKRVYQRYPDEFVLIRQVEQEPDRILYFRSPRFEASS